MYGRDKNKDKRYKIIDRVSSIYIVVSFDTDFLLPKTFNKYTNIEPYQYLGSLDNPL